MVGFLNILPFVLLLLGGWWTYEYWKSKKEVKGIVARVFCTLVAISLYYQFQPSYMPKGEIVRNNNLPAFERKGIEVKDISLKPVSGEERDRVRKEQYKETLPFLEKEVDN